MIEWFRSGLRSSARYRILRGGPNSDGVWTTTYCFERGNCERYEVIQEVIVEMTSRESEEFHSKLMQWIKTWWDTAKK